MKKYFIILCFLSSYSLPILAENMGYESRKSYFNMGVRSSFLTDNFEFTEFSPVFQYGRVLSEQSAVSLGIRLLSQISGIQANYEYSFSPQEDVWVPGVETFLNVGAKGRTQATIEFFRKAKTKMENKGKNGIEEGIERTLSFDLGAGAFLKMNVSEKVAVLLKAGLKTYAIALNGSESDGEGFLAYMDINFRWYFH